MKKVVAAMGCWLVLLAGLWSVAAAGDYKLPDTGIHKCYDAGKEIPCPSPGQPFYGQDAQYDGPQPAYRDNGDGTVTDLNTGLMWQQNDDGTTLTWQAAIDYCAALTFPSGGYSDWRLPDRRELMSIVDFGRIIPSIDTTYFPNCRSSYYWSSSPYAYHSLYAWSSISSTATCTTLIRTSTPMFVVCAPDLDH